MATATRRDGADAPAWRRHAPLALVVAAAVALYAGSLRAGFVFDDAHTILRHRGVTGPFSLRAIFLRDWWGEPLGSAASLGSWRPVATLTFWIDAHVGGGSAAAFHAGNLLVFAALLIAIDRFLEAWLGDALRLGARRFVLAAFGALAMHTEVVANATGRAEMLALLFAVLALHAAVRPPTPLRLAALATALLLALFSKESAFPIALLAPVLAFRRPDDAGRGRALKVGLTSLAVLGVAIVLRAKLVGHLPRFDPAQQRFDNPLIGTGTSTRLAGAFEVLTQHLQHAATGADLCPDYSYAAGATAGGFGVRALVGLAAYVAAGYALLRAVRARPRLAEAFAGFFAAYLAVSQLLFPAPLLFADRVFFAPSLFLLVVVGLLAEALLDARPRLRPLVALAAGAFVAEQALMTALTVPAWTSNLTLTSYGVRTCPTVIRLRIERLHAARAAGEIEEGAWNALAAATLFAQFPRPVEDDLLPSEEQPVEDRIVSLQRKLGPAFGRVRAQAIVLAQNVPYPEAARALGAP